VENERDLQFPLDTREPKFDLHEREKVLGVADTRWIHVNLSSISIAQYAKREIFSLSLSLSRFYKKRNYEVFDLQKRIISHSLSVYFTQQHCLSAKKKKSERARGKCSKITSIDR
jgi:hypothetical protein